MINRKMSIEEVVKKHPETVGTFERHGLGCIACQAALFESIEQGAEVHGIDTDALIADLNKEIKRAGSGVGNGK
jgi:hybrid cluster-associated redox disulfide protein